MDDPRANEILELYAQLGDVTARMRQAASISDWDGLIALEAQCADVSARLLSCEDDLPRNEEYQRRKANLICKVLDDDAEIRQSVNVRLAGLWRLIDGRERVEKLNSAYGSDTGIPGTPSL